MNSQKKKTFFVDLLVVRRRDCALLGIGRYHSESQIAFNWTATEKQNVKEILLKMHVIRKRSFENVLEVLVHPVGPTVDWLYSLLRLSSGFWPH